MNTEINFLEKQPNKFTAVLVIGIVFCLLFACVVAILLFQKNYYENQIETQKNTLSQMETLLIEHRNEYSDERELHQLRQDIVNLKAELKPNVALYNEVIAFLPTPDQLISYDSTNENQLIIAAEFGTLRDVASYVAELLKQNYVIGTELTSVSKVETTYQATLTMSIDSEVLVKELDEND